MAHKNGGGVRKNALVNKPMPNVIISSSGYIKIENAAYCGKNP